ncbi:MAG: NAD-dependent epimerase/dehydratase family protein [Gemmataceae bacterium]|nr:NAD-dependent epimerase/dehydratase family protein [Gemmataceae bacterium]
MRTLITGASGFVGGHIAEACLRRGWPLHLLARPTSALSHLEKEPGVTVFRGELHDAGVVRQAVADVEAVIHCAAKVGDWGPLEEYRRANVESLRVLLDACKGLALGRFVHMSSLGVYAAGHHYGTDETAPLPRRHRDGYTQSKVEAEVLAFQYHRDFGIPVVAVRPGFIYGPGDRTVLPRIIDNLRCRLIRYPGGGRRLLNTIFIRNLVDAVFLALENDAAVGEAFNVTDGEVVSKRRFIEKIADALDLPRPGLGPPLWVARHVTWWYETLWRLFGAKHAPPYSFAKLKFIGYNLDFSIEKARRILGYRPRVAFDDAMAETLAWYRTQAGTIKGAVAVPV